MLYTSAVVFVLLALIIAHIIAPTSYDWTQHTISQLAAQGYELSWVMNAGFIGFGTLVLAGAMKRLDYDPRGKWTEGPLVVCGVMFILSSIFHTRPFIENFPYSERDAMIHGAMSTLARFAIAVSMLGYTIFEMRRIRKVVYLFSLLVVIGLNVILETSEFSAGVVQRLLCGVVLVWFIFIEVEQKSYPAQKKGKYYLQ
jgi:hypothetical membrane protein